MTAPFTVELATDDGELDLMMSGLVSYAVSGSKSMQRDHARHSNPLDCSPRDS